MTMLPTVYLAGGILGHNKAQANTWRVYASDILKEQHIRGISPLRCEPLVGKRYNLNYKDPKFGTARAIGAKNIFDVKQCTAMIAFLPLPPKSCHQSWGTMAEIGAARALDKPVVTATNDPKVRDHPVLDGFSSWVLFDKNAQAVLDEALDLLIGLVSAYGGGKNV